MTAYRIRETAYGPNGEPGASTYSDDAFALELQQFQLAERGVAAVVEQLRGGAYVHYPQAPVVTVEDAIAAGHATRNRGAGGEYAIPGPGFHDFLNPRPATR